MTAQISDFVEWEGEEYSINAIENEWPFDPTKEGFKPKCVHTACWRGFHCRYEVAKEELRLKDFYVSVEGILAKEWRGVAPKKGEFFKHDRQWLYSDLSLPISYSGGIVLCREFLHDFYVHMGFHRPHCYKHVYELTFEEGILLSATDESPRMEAARSELKKNKKKWSTKPTKNEISDFVEDSFSLKYEKKWS
ncbi:hypothetical protein [Pelagicoccus sp. SDUM812003]|uniref:hypothetical protein n=1 Tax=Pelagicoccus sp. SDUM812003 TaxID=3041267 RepID=UPI00280D7F1F|nr:hypothetical protein [Pelagicoccus sp. SDUM812003]MDQ8205713.1 hypothetical protein [Pelagicoccus sp. SDUM812003]